MITVDDRKGSGEVAPILRGLGVPVKVERMESADFAFEGQGPRGSCMIGVERKRVRELLKDLEEGRFEGEQLHKMLQAYQDQSWLVVEGVWRPNPQSGVLEEGTHGGWREVLLGSRGFAFCQLDNYLTSLQSRVHLRIKYTGAIEETAHVVKGMWQWYRKPWSQHRTGLVIYESPAPTALWIKPNLVRKMANQLEGIGWEKSGAVAAKFATVLDMVTASEREWQTIPGIGKGLAEKAVRQLWGKENG